MVGEVLSLGAHRADKTGDCRAWSPVECLRDTVREIEAGERPCNAVLVLLVEHDDEHFDLGYNVSNMKATQILAALEIAKIRLLREMGYAANP